MNYYCKFHKWTTTRVWHWLNKKLIEWTMCNKKIGKFKEIRWLEQVCKTQPGLFDIGYYLHQYLIRGKTLTRKRWMKRAFHVQCCERFNLKCFYLFDIKSEDYIGIFIFLYVVLINKSRKK
jgi:hypothetical protein